MNELSDRMRKHLGIPLSWPLRAVLDAIGMAWDQAVTYLSEPERRRRQVDRLCDDFRSSQEDRRAAAALEAVDRGKRLLRIRLFNGRLGWSACLARLGLSRRTYDNLRALVLLAQIRPDLFVRLQALGPTKLYRLARLDPKDLEAIDLSATVSYDGRKVRLKDLSDRELAEYLRKRFPVEERPVRSRLKSHAMAFHRMLENCPRRERPPLDDLTFLRELLRDSARSVERLIRACA